MGRVANEFADTVVVTSDNPRDEDALDIIGQISTHISADKLHISPDRAEAIQLAVQQAKSGDVVLVAGKGHEAYQEIAGVRYPFSDAETVQQILSRWSA
jgi:UDP-N-acetylmuramoyl-L-alanyl-D-glutamate--2,6-diaminopimelate ligase